MSTGKEKDLSGFEYVEVNGRQIRVRPSIARENDEFGYFRRQGNHYSVPFLDVDGTIPGDPEGKDGLGRIAGVDLRGKKTLSVEDGKPVQPRKAEPYRYRLVWAKLCHWSNRNSIVRELEGLEDAISVNMVEHSDYGRGLGWSYVYNDGNKDPLTGDEFLSEAYYRADDTYDDRTTVPALIDLKAPEGPVVVSNDYNWLSVYLETAFRPFHKKGAPDLYPKALRKDIDALNLWLFDNINNSVYRDWFAGSKEAYKEGFRTFYAAMDVLEKRLATHRFLFGDYVTESDIRLYVTLSRLDIRYTFQLGETKQRLVDYPNLWGYARDLWQIPAFRNNTYFADFANPETNDLGAYRASYNYRFLRQIDFDGLWGQPTERAKLSKDPAHKFLAETDGGTARTEDGTGFIGYSQTPEEAAAWKKDAEIYAKIRAVKSWKIEKVDEPAVKDPKDLPVFTDDRPAEVEAILTNIAAVSDKPALTRKPEDLTPGGTAGSVIAEGKQRIGTEEELVAARKYVKDNVTDTVTTLLTSVKLQDFEDAYQVLYTTFETLDEKLAGRRFLLGDFVSLADVELFVTLVRFDSLYSRQLGATRHRLVDYPHLWGYARDLYIIPAFRKSVDWKRNIASISPAEEKENYSPNQYYDTVLPAVDLDAVWETETDRAALSSDPTKVYLETFNRRFDR